jgi:clan AA aspartic protease
LQVVFRKNECHAFQSAYAVPVVLSNVITGRSVSIAAVIDTGFDGSIMVDSETYGSLQLELSEKPEGQFPAYRTFSGTVLFKSSLSRAKIAGRDVLTEVIAPVHGRGKCLLGREILKQFATLLLRAERSCLGDAEVQG